MRFARLTPYVNPRTGAPTWPLRCEAIREGKYANDFLEAAKDLEWFRCQHNAKFSVGRHNVCIKHAASLALSEKLDVPPGMDFWTDGDVKEKLRRRMR